MWHRCVPAFAVSQLGVLTLILRPHLVRQVIEEAFEGHPIVEKLGGLNEVLRPLEEAKR